MSEKIIFQEGREEWLVGDSSLLFIAAKGDEIISCILPFKTVMDSYSGDMYFNAKDRQQSCKDIYKKHRDSIHGRCREMIEDGQVDRNGQLIIASI